MEALRREEITGCSKGVITIYYITVLLGYRKFHYQRPRGSDSHPRAYSPGELNEPGVATLQGIIQRVCVATDLTSTQGVKSCMRQLRESRLRVSLVKHLDLELPQAEVMD